MDAISLFIAYNRFAAHSSHLVDASPIRGLLLHEFLVECGDALDRANLWFRESDACVADAPAINFTYGHNSCEGSSHEALISGVDIGEREVRLFDCNTVRLAHLEHRFCTRERQDHMSMYIEQSVSPSVRECSHI